MTSKHRVFGLILLPFVLAGCTATGTPAPTVTVTATPAAATLKPGDAAPWDFRAVCAAESEAETLVVWRDQQTKAGRLSPAQSEAVLQAIAVQYLEFNQSGLPSSVRADIARLVDAAGTLEHPTIDLGSKPVESAKNQLHQTCQAAGLTIGVIAQGG